MQYLRQCQIMKRYSVECLCIYPRIRNSMNVVLWWMRFEYRHSEGKRVWFSPSHPLCHCEEFRMVDVIILRVLLEIVDHAPKLELVSTKTLTT